MSRQGPSFVVYGECETLEGVREFHEAFGCYTADGPEMPHLTEEQIMAMNCVAEALEIVAKECFDLAEKHSSTPGTRAFLRLQLQVEELCERARAYEHQNIVELLDALADEQYVLDGAFLAHGLDSLKLLAFREVQRSNMTKLGADGKPIINEAGRVVKGPNYEKPKLRELMYRFFYGGTDKPGAPVQ